MIEGARPRRRRLLSAEDRHLWELVTQSVAPLRRRAGLAPASTAAEAAPSLMPAAQSRPTPESVGRPAAAAPMRAQVPPPLTELGRRERHRVARGSAPLDARIDLHGMTQDRAHRALTRFLRVAQANDARLVLVITGKGSRPGEADAARERGVLRRMVPHWLSLPELRVFVLGFESAHAAHGGEGALYVRLRRAR